MVDFIEVLIQVKVVKTSLFQDLHSGHSS